MGLDNGIVFKGIKREDIPNWIQIYYNSEPEEIELVYFRKYWGLRTEINHLLHLPYEKYECKVDIEDIPAIRKIIMKYMNSEYWGENADSIWDYDEALPHMIQILVNLYWIEEYMKEHSEVTAEWYDSY